MALEIKLGDKSFEPIKRGAWGQVATTFKEFVSGMVITLRNLDRAELWEKVHANYLKIYYGNEAALTFSGLVHDATKGSILTTRELALAQGGRYPDSQGVALYRIAKMREAQQALLEYNPNLSFAPR